MSRKRPIASEQLAAGKDQEEGSEAIETEDEWVFGMETESLVSSEDNQNTVQRPIQTGRIVDWARFAALW